MKGKKIAICQSNYIPWKGYFDLISQCDVFVVYDEVQYTKNDWRNRNQIRTSHGLHWLTIPVKGGIGDKIDEVHAVGNYWREKHWHSLFHHYHKAPCFSEYSALFERLYLKDQETNLSKINQKFMHAVCSALGITTRMVDSRQIPRKAFGKTERLIEIIRYLEGSIYVSGGKAKAYLDTARLEEENIGLIWMEYGNYPEYRQLHAPFLHQVSILDLLFNKGKEASAFIHPSLCILAS